jgi:high affinity Mn2+ porin
MSRSEQTSNPAPVFLRQRSGQNLFLVVSAYVALSVPVFAAEPPPAFSWAGAYIGGNIGAGIPSSTQDRLQAGSGFGSTEFDLFPPSGERAGITLGAQAGYNWQLGPWVYGVEMDFSFLDGRGAQSGTFPAPPAYWPLGVFSYNVDYDQSANYFASFRGRLGYALDRSLFYITAGVAAGGARGPATLALIGGGPDSPFTTGPSQSSRMKYAVGAGYEYALADNWSVRLEYLFLDLSLNTHLFDNGADFRYVSRTRNENHVFRLGLNYLLGTDNNVADHAGAQRGKQSDGDSELYSVHGQSTGVLQGYPKFPARYTGPNSFTPFGQARFGSTTNLFAGLRVWEGGAMYVNPEISEGFGLSNSVGAASYVNGAVAKVGSAAPYLRYHRYFLRQVIGLDGIEQETGDAGSLSELLEATQNQLAGKVDKNRLVLTIGKFAVGDVFDDNVYAHDPTTGFLNFAFNTMGAFDYAADSWGYTYGAALEWKQDWWSARAGVFQLSDVPNSETIEPVLLRQYMGVGEFEVRYALLDQPGVVKFLLFADNGYLNKVDEVVDIALATGKLPPDITNNDLRKRRVKFGGGINVQQQLMPGLGFFLRASMADGRYETVDYTDIDKSVSGGFVASGELWGRPKDEIGAAGVVSGLSPSRVRYFALGGTSVYIGDGALSYDGEKAMEAYYKWGVLDGVDITFDYQFFPNPAHNLDRGPVSVFGMRLHGEF